MAASSAPREDAVVDSDDDEEEEEEDAQRAAESDDLQVMLGFVSPPEHPALLQRRFFPSKVGGKPVGAFPAIAAAARAVPRGAHAAEPLRRHG